MKLSRVKGTTSQIVQVLIKDSSSTVGAGLTGLVYNSAGLVAYYKRSSGTASAAITLATITTLGTFNSGGFKEVDATNMPGLYEFHIPNAALATGADNVVIMLQGAANMVPVAIEIELTGWDNQDSVRGGLSTLPSTVMAIKKNTALAAFPFPMYDTCGSPRTGLTITANRSLDGGAFGACANAASELGNGWYLIDLDAGDLNGKTVALNFSATGAQDFKQTIITQD